MQYGFSLIMRGEAATPEAFRQTAAKAEALELDALWCSSHLVMPPLTKSRYAMSADGKLPLAWQQRYWEPWTVLSHLAALTKRIRLGTSVLILPMHHPVEVAALVSDLDQLSGGRFTLGVGVGWYEEEFDLLGWPFRQRGARANEGLALMKALWSQQPVDFQGRFHQIAQAHFGPKPVQKPHPPIWIGGGSEAALRRTALHGDCWHPNRPGIAALRKGKATLARLLQEQGRAPEAVSIAVKAPLLVQSSTPAENPTGTVGRPEDIAGAMLRYRDEGVEEFVFDFVPEELQQALDTLDAFAQEVRPRLENR